MPRDWEGGVVDSARQQKYSIEQFSFGLETKTGN